MIGNSGGQGSLGGETGGSGKTGWSWGDRGVRGGFYIYMDRIDRA